MRNRTTPSYVASSDSERLIGDVKNQAKNPTNTAPDAKRLIGRKLRTVQSDMNEVAQ
jgi:L1 cell adhesion molecule like protein